MVGFYQIFKLKLQTAWIIVSPWADKLTKSVAQNYL